MNSTCHLIGRATVACMLTSTAFAQATSLRRLDGSTISVTEADAYTRRVLADNHVTGAQVAVVNDGQLVWSAAYGVRRREPLLPMERETVTWAASLTKSVFGTYVMQLVERGKFDLDTPIAAQLAQPLNTYEAYREAASALVNEASWASVTPRMLLAHTSGLANLAALAPDKKMHLAFTPGSQYRYSGDGINIVQFVIEQHAGVHLDTLMNDAFFAPLGMHHTGMIYRAEFAPNVSDRFGDDERFLAQTRRYPARAAGNMMSTAEDVATFLCALLQDRIISPASRNAMLRPFIDIRSMHQFGDTAEGESKEAAAVGLSYGVGWGLLTTTPFGPAFFKEGHGDGAQNYMICFQNSKSCMVILTNSDNGELAFKPLLEKILGDTVTPWEWEGYTPAYIQKARGK